MDEIYYNSKSRGRIPVSDMCDEHVRRAFKKLLREREIFGGYGWVGQGQIDPIGQTQFVNLPQK